MAGNYVDFLSKSSSFKHRKDCEDDGKAILKKLKKIEENIQKQETEYGRLSREYTQVTGIDLEDYENEEDECDEDDEEDK